MKVLMIGDVVGQNGCEYLRQVLPGFKRRQGIDVCIANGENCAQGNGITPLSAEHLFVSGVDFITTGNHAFRRPEMLDMYDSSLSVIRPANFHRSCPGRGVGIIDKGSIRLAVINLIGSAYMEPVGNPFDTVDELLKGIDKNIKTVIVDFHAEATAEKRCMGFYLDGRVTALVGTHTHVRTADACILPKGTAYMTDLGMTGPINSVLGVEPTLAIEKMRTNLPVRFENSDGECRMEGCLLEIDKSTGRASSICGIEL